MATSWNWTITIPWIISFLTLGVGIYQYSHNQAQANREPFLRKQLELVFQISETVAELATDVDADRWEQARLRFWRLYWGPLSIVENREVEAEMVALGRIVPKSAVSTPNLPMESLRGPSYRLAHAVRKLSMESWDVDLPALEADRTDNK